MFNLTAEEKQVTTTRPQVPEHVLGYSQKENGEIMFEEVFIPIKKVLQLPELPHGCEVTSLSAVLSYYGYHVTKTMLSDRYLPKKPFEIREGIVYGPDPYKFYAGEPSEQTGFFAYAPPIVETVKQYMKDVQGDLNPKDITGSSREEIINQLNKGIPVIIWVTLDLSPPKINYSWQIKETGEHYQAPTNLHVVVLNGYSEDKVFTMNPLEGQVEYNRDRFFDSYEALGKHAVVIENH